MAIVAIQTGRERAVIGPETQIERDLGCTGDEARALVERLGAEFGIDMSGLDPDLHFDSASSLIWPIGVSAVVALPAVVFVVATFGTTLLSWGIIGTRAAANGGLFLLVYLVAVLLLVFITTVLPALRARGGEKVPITVQMLIEAAALRRWPTSYGKGPLP